MQLNIKFPEIPSIKFCARAAIKFASHTQTCICINSEIVIMTSQNMQIHRKQGVQNFYDSNIFFYIVYKRK